MREIQDVSETIKVEIRNESVTVILGAKQYQLNRLEQYQLFLGDKTHLLPGKVIEATEEQLVIEYQKNKYADTLEVQLKRMDIFQRLLLAQKLYFLNDFMTSPIQPFLHPANLFVFGEELLIAHRGFVQAVVPYRASEEDFLKQYRALVLVILQPKLDYEHLIEGNGTLKDSLSKKIQVAESVEQIRQIIGEEVVRQKVRREAENRVVSKTRYLAFKWSTLILGICTIGLAITAGVYAFDQLPAQKRISSAETFFIANDYASVLTTLKDDQPEHLPRGTQYVAAVSAVQLDNLSNEQKTALLNNLSQKSSENTLLYWIYIGNGAFDKSLDIAQNLGDNQYILHAYTKLYDATRANNKMSGEKKQELLTKYEEEINKYLEVLGGKLDGNEEN